VLVNVALGHNMSASDVLARCSDDIAAIEHELGSHGRVLVRASGTEPLIRVMVEADTENMAKEVAARLASVVSSSEKK
jgi:phosphoglucosamine mutase